MEVKSNTSGKPRHPQVGSDLQAPKAGARSQRDPVLSLQSRQLRVCTNVQNQQEESVDLDVSLHLLQALEGGQEVLMLVSVEAVANLRKILLWLG